MHLFIVKNCYIEKIRILNAILTNFYILIIFLIIILNTIIKIILLWIEKNTCYKYFFNFYYLCKYVKMSFCFNL